CFFFSSRRRHTISKRDWSSDVCSSDLTQMFNLLCEKADDVYGGRLPVHVRCLIDECANIGHIPKLEKLVATIRSREISACLVLRSEERRVGKGGGWGEGKDEVGTTRER